MVDEKAHRTSDEFFNLLLAEKKKAIRDSGGSVYTAALIYSNITKQDEVDAYREALSMLLESDDDESRRFGVHLCMGFYEFRDQLPPLKSLS